MKGLLFPSKCILCTRILDRNETDICTTCRGKMPLYSAKRTRIPHLAKVTALWYYKEEVRSSIHRFKFYGRRSYAAAYGRLLAEELCRQGVSFDILTWAPVSFLRFLHRGYDQSHLIAKALGKNLGIPPLRTLRKIFHTKPQSLSGDYAHRKANVLGAYRCICPEEVREKRILLVDDICTTGATASECARMLLTAGAQSVSLAVLAVAEHTKNSR